MNENPERLTLSQADWTEINAKAISLDARLIQVTSQPWQLDSIRSVGDWRVRTAYLITFYVVDDEEGDGRLSRDAALRFLYVTEATANVVGDWVALPEPETVAMFR